MPMAGYWIYVDTYGWPDALVRRSRQPGTTNTVIRISHLVLPVFNYLKAVSNSTSVHFERQSLSPKPLLESSLCFF